MHKQIVQLSEEWNIPSLFWNLGIFAIALIIGLIITAILNAFLRFRKEKEKHFSVFYSALEHFRKPLSFFIPLLVLNFAIPFLLLQPYELKVLTRCLEIGLIISFSWLLFALIHTVQDYVIERFNLSKADNLRERKVRTQLQFIRQILKGIIILVTIAAVLLTFSAMRKIGTGLLTGVGIGGIIIGIAAQRTLANLLAGFQIAFTQPIRIDDAVVVEGEFGFIEEITLTYITVRIWDERRLILPITYFLEKPFQNWTRNSAQLTGTVYLYTDYTIPVETIRNELLRLLELNPFWDKRASGLTVTDIKERTVELRALMSARNSGELWDLRCYIRERLLSFINEKLPDYLPKARAEITESKKEESNE